MTEEEKNLVKALAPFGIDATDIVMLRSGDMLGPRTGAKFAATISRLVAERDEARKALKPFADYAPFVRMFVEGRAAQGGSPILPTKHFRLADFERARSALGPKPDNARRSLGEQE